MNIAIIGWGSLIWAPKNLATRSRWHKDGPCLPIEFARVSGDGRLTLVIHEGSREQRTYWAVSALNTEQEARANLAEREKSPVSRIRFAHRDTIRNEADAIEVAVRNWLSAHPALDAAIWTGLAAKLEGPDLVAAAVSYLMGLRPDSDEYQLAREYVVKAPDQIQTDVRQEMQRRCWLDTELPPELFEP
jgi:hypothetical protein